MANGLALDMGKVIVDQGGAAVGGLIQRLAWEQSAGMGFLTTGALALGGLLAQGFTRGQTQQLLGALSSSGFAVGGWIGAEQFFLGGSDRPKAIGLFPKAAGRLNGLGARVPGASVAGVTRTGEKILFAEN